MSKYQPPSAPRSEELGERPALYIHDDLRERYEMWRQEEDDKKRRKDQKADEDDE